MLPSVCVCVCVRSCFRAVQGDMVFNLGKQHVGSPASTHMYTYTDTHHINGGVRMQNTCTHAHMLSSCTKLINRTVLA